MMNAAFSTRDYYTVKEAATYLKASQRTVREAIKDGRFTKSWKADPGYGKKFQTVVPKAEVHAYMKNGNFKKPNGAKNRRKKPKKFVSVPMARRKKKDILEDIGYMAKCYPESEIVHNYNEKTPPKRVIHKDVWYLGQALQKMAECEDVVFCNKEWRNSKGCVIERLVYDFYFKDCFKDMKEDILWSDLTKGGESKWWI